MGVRRYVGRGVELGVNVVDSPEIVAGAVDFSHLSADAMDYVQDHELSLLQGLGSDVKAWTIPPTDITGSVALVDQRLLLTPLWLPEDATITGVCWAQSVQGSTTADNENRVGLYTSNGTTLTLVASCADDGDLWDDAAGVVSKAFSATYAATAGLLYTGILYSSSAEATAPEIGHHAAVAGVYPSFRVTADNLRSARLNSQTSLPASVTLSTTSENFLGIPCIGLY